MLLAIKRYIAIHPKKSEYKEKRAFFIEMRVANICATLLELTVLNVFISNIYFNFYVLDNTSGY